MPTRAELRRLYNMLLAMRSINATANETIILLHALLVDVPISLDSIVAATGVSRSSVSDVLRYWRKVEVGKHLPRKGFEFSPSSKAVILRFLDETYDIGYDRRRYFSDELLEKILIPVKGNRRKLDHGMAHVMRNRKLSER